MAAHSESNDAATRDKWRGVLRRLFGGAPRGAFGTDTAPGAFDRALASRFGLELPRREPDCSRHSAPDLGQWN